LKKAAWSGAALSAAPSVIRGYDPPDHPDENPPRELKISLAQWSLHNKFSSGDLDPVDFAAISMNTYGIDAVEYVNQFYVDSARDEKFWTGMKRRADNAGVKSLLIMVDDEGDLGVADNKVRKESVENHYKWINAAKLLGCHSIRVNAFGEPEREAYRVAMVDSMGELGEYAARENMNVVIENHGLFSSDAKLIAGIIEEVNLPNCGTLPDFGNWCLSAKWGTTQGSCDRAYDIYKGVAELLPYAKGVSAKSYNFNAKGENTKIDYYRMLRIVKESGYDGYIGIEYEGEELGEHEGILATMALLKKAWESLD